MPDIDQHLRRCFWWLLLLYLAPAVLDWAFLHKGGGVPGAASLTLGTATAIAVVAMLPRHTSAIETRAENICSLRAFLI